MTRDSQHVMAQECYNSEMKTEKSKRCKGRIRTNITKSATKLIDMTGVLNLAMPRFMNCIALVLWYNSIWVLFCW